MNMFCSGQSLQQLLEGIITERISSNVLWYEQIVTKFKQKKDCVVREELSVKKKKRSIDSNEEHV